MTLTQEITLDIYEPPYFEYVNAKQADNISRVLIITLTANGDPLKPNAESEVAVFRALKPDGTYVLNPATIGEDGKVTVKLTDQTLAKPGKVEADVSIVHGDEVLSSATMYIQVTRAPVSGKQITSTNEFLVMTEAAAEAKDAAAAANKAAKNADDATGRANAAAQLLEGMTVTVHDVEPGGEATAALTREGDHYDLDLGLVKGKDGQVQSVNGGTGDVVIGGRNILTGTKDFSGEWGGANAWVSDGTINGFSIKKSTVQFSGISKGLNVKKGETYTMSGWIKSTENAIASFHSGQTDENIEPSAIVLTLGVPAGTWTRVSQTFNVLNDCLIFPRFENASPDANSTDNTISIYGLKLERGTVATDWTPAPEDKADVPTQFDVFLPASGWINGSQTVADVRFIDGDNIDWDVDVKGACIPWDGITITEGQMVARADIVPVEDMTWVVTRREVRRDG